MTVFVDDFERPDSTDLGVIPGAGWAWVELSGVWSIVGGKPTTTTGRPLQPMVVADLRTNVPTIDVDATEFGGDALYFRVVDVQNWWRVATVVSGTAKQVKIQRSEAGNVYDVLTRNTQFSGPSSYSTVGVSFSGTSGQTIGLRINGSVQTYTTSTVHLNATLHGFGIHHEGSVSPSLIDNFTFEVENTRPTVTLLSPIAGVTVPSDGSVRFSYDFADADPGDHHTYQWIRYRQAGTTAWTAVNRPTTLTWYDWPPGTFTDGVDYEWQAGGSDQNGLTSYWSSTGAFTAASTPGAPAIVAPADQGTIPTTTYTVQWSIQDQDAYQLRTVADDGAGNPDDSVVHYDSGTVVEPATRLRAVDFPINGRTEHVQVRVQFDGLWSPWASVAAAVTYTRPPAATFDQIEGVPADALMSVRWSHPAPVGSQPAVTGIDLHRRETGSALDGDVLPQGVGLAPSGTHLDRTVGAGIDYEYRIRTYGANGTTALTAWIGDPAEQVPPPDLQITPGARWDDVDPALRWDDVDPGVTWEDTA